MPSQLLPLRRDGFSRPNYLLFMTLRLFTTPLLAAFLLLSTLGCAKKEDDATPVPAAGMASYQLDGRTITCKAQLSIDLNVNGTSLNVHLITTPQPTTGEETLDLYYYKDNTHYNSNYYGTHLIFVTRDTNGSLLPGVGFTADKMTLTALGNGRYSGTFEVKSIYATPTRTITAGVFTEVHQ